MKGFAPLADVAVADISSHRFCHVWPVVPLVHGVVGTLFAGVADNLRTVNVFNDFGLYCFVIRNVQLVVNV